MKDTKPQVCEDCEDGVSMRRTRCKRCGLLVCAWCYHHVHALHIGGFNPPACAADTAGGSR